MSHRQALLAGFVLLTVAPCILAGPADILRAAAQPDASAADLTAWKNLEHEASLPALLDALTGDEVTLALFAVEHLDTLDLTLAELRLAGRLVTDHPERWCGPGSRSIRRVVGMLGVNEVARFWEAVVEKGLDFHSGESLNTHRPIVPEHLPLLVALLPRATPTTRGTLAQLIATGADGIDRHRHIVARGLLYAHARREQENGGPPAPALDEIRIEVPATGLPPAFRKLAGIAWDLDPVHPGRDPKQRDSSPRWIQRWSYELTPGPDDLAWLVTAAKRASWKPGRVAAVRLIGRLSTDEATKALEKIAGATDRTAAFAAAELSRRGRPERFEAMLAPDSPDIDARSLGDVWRLACEVRPDIVPRDIDALADLHEWAEYEESYGVRRPVALIETVIREAIADEDGDLRPFLPLLVLRPDLLTREAEDRLVEELRTWGPWIEEDMSPEEAEEEFEGGDEDTLYDELPTDSPVRLFMGLLEVRRPERLRALLDGWLKGKSPGARATARALDLRLDVGKRHGVQVLPGQKVDPALEGQLTMGTWLEEGEEPEEPWITYNRLCAEGRPLDAALHVIAAEPDQHEDSLAYLAMTPTKEVLRLLREVRASRRAYWPATLALAIAGDTDARAESLGMIRDGRTWMFDRLNFAPALTCAADPEFVAHWVDRIEACCCQAWPSCWILGCTFPVLDIPEIVRGHMATQRQACAMLAGTHFRRSHILDAWVPIR